MLAGITSALGDALTLIGSVAKSIFTDANLLPFAIVIGIGVALWLLTALLAQFRGG